MSRKLCECTALGFLVHRMSARHRLKRRWNQTAAGVATGLSQALNPKIITWLLMWLMALPYSVRSSCSLGRFSKFLTRLRTTMGLPYRAQRSCSSQHRGRCPLYCIAALIIASPCA